MAATAMSASGACFDCGDLLASAAAVSAAADAVARLAVPTTDLPSSTFVSAVLQGSAVTVCWLADSRACWVGADVSYPAPPAAITDPLGAVRALAGFALEAGGMDNVTAVLAPFPSPGGSCRTAADARAASPDLRRMHR